MTSGDMGTMQSSSSIFRASLCSLDPTGLREPPGWFPEPLSLREPVQGCNPFGMANCMSELQLSSGGQQSSEQERGGLWHGTGSGQVAESGCGFTRLRVLEVLA